MTIRLFTAALLALFAPLFLAACNPMAQLDGAESKIAQFHKVYNDGDARVLYGMTGEQFRAATTPQQMDELIALVAGRMGKVESSERAGFNINSDNGVNMTVVTMTTQFEKGEAEEVFTFQGSGEEMQMVGWNVESDNFLNEAEGAAEDSAPEASEPEAQAAE